MPRKQKKYHYIYRTTCLITGKFYVGMHSAEDLEDGYLGSGKILGYSIGKHGRENHKREILEFLPDREALKLREAEFVNKQLLTDPLNMNLKYGGEGGGFHAEKNKTNGFHRAGWEKMMLKKDCSAASKKVWARHREKMLSVVGKNTAKMINAAASIEAIEKKKKTFAERGHMQGSKNSQFGTCWVSNELGPKKIKKDDLVQFLSIGYCEGRKYSK